MSKNVQKISVIFGLVVTFGGFLTLLMTWKNIGLQMAS